MEPAASASSADESPPPPDEAREAREAREVRDLPDDHRYEIRLGGEVAGFAIYHRRGGRAFFVHTEIDPAFEGKGLGSALAAGALDHERTLGEPVVPLCPFIRSFIDRHPDYGELVDHEMLARIDGD